MRMQNKILFALCLCVWLLSGCKSTKKVGTVEVGSMKSQTELLESIEKNSFQFNTLSARLNVDLDIPGQKMSSRVDLKMVKDSAFQLSVQPFLGIEVFRIQLTPDSIVVLDRLNKRYMAENYENLRGQTPLEFNFYNLQALFINHLFLPGQKGVTKKHFNRFKLSEEGSMAELKVKDSMGLEYVFIADGEEKLLSTFVSDPSDHYALQWLYSDFRISAGQPFPNLMDVQVLVDGASKGGVKIYFSRIQTNQPLNMEFSIPSKYNRITFAQILKTISNSTK